MIKFGDVVNNRLAAPENPNKVGIVIEVCPRYIVLTDGEGSTWEIPKHIIDEGMAETITNVVDIDEFNELKEGITEY